MKAQLNQALILAQLSPALFALCCLKLETSGVWYGGNN